MKLAAWALGLSLALCAAEARRDRTKLSLTVLPNGSVLYSTLVTANCSFLLDGPNAFHLELRGANWSFAWAPRPDLFDELGSCRRRLGSAPAPQNACFNSSDGRFRLCRRSSPSSGSLAFSAAFRASKEFNGEVTCRLRRAKKNGAEETMEKKVTLSVIDYYFSVTPSKTVAGQKVTVSCAFVLPKNRTAPVQLTGAASDADRTTKEEPVSESHTLLKTTASWLLKKSDHCTRLFCISGKRKEEKTITVGYRPNIVNLQPPNLSSVAFDSTLTCIAEGFPLPKVNIRVRNRGTSSPSYSASSGLRVASLNLSRFIRRYLSPGWLEVICIARNSYGRTSSQWALRLETPAQKEPKFSFSVLPNQSVHPSTAMNLTCGSLDRSRAYHIVIAFETLGQSFNWTSNRYFVDSASNCEMRVPANSCFRSPSSKFKFCATPFSLTVLFDADRNHSAPVTCSVRELSQGQSAKAEPDIRAHIEVADLLLTVTPPNPKPRQLVEVVCSVLSNKTNESSLEITGLEWWSKAKDEQTKIGKATRWRKIRRRNVKIADHQQTVTCAFGKLKKTFTLKLQGMFPRGWKRNDLRLSVSPWLTVVPSTRMNITCSYFSSFRNRFVIDLRLRNPPRNISWVNDGHLVEDDNCAKYMRVGSCNNNSDSTFTVCGSKNAVTLLFTATEEHSGEVVCRVRRVLSTKYLLCNTSVSIEVNRSMVIQTSPREPKAGQVVKLSCLYRADNISGMQTQFDGLNSSSEMLQKTNVDKTGWITLNLMRNVTPADNGRNISCSYGNLTKTRTLDVLYPPSIFTFLPRGPIFPDMAMTCEAKGNPRPLIKLFMYDSSGERFRSRQGLGLGKIYAETMAVAVSCEASNDLGRVKQRKEIRIQNPLILDMGRGPFILGKRHRISCDCPDPQMAQMEFQIPKEKLRIKWSLGSSFLQVVAATWIGNVTWFPFKADKVTIEQARGRAIVVSLTAELRLNTSDVICVAERKSQDHTPVERKKVIRVEVEAAISSVSVAHEGGDTGQVLEGVPVFVRCKGRLGKAPMSTVVARIGKRQLGTPSVIEHRPAGEPPLLEFVWRTTMTRAEDKTRAQCCIGDREDVSDRDLRVYYAPGESDIQITISTSSIQCVAESRPIARVELEIESFWRGTSRKQKQGDIVNIVTIGITARKGERVVIWCTAINRYGRAAKTITKVFP